MLRLATDEDFNNRIVRGLLRRQPDLDILRVQGAGLAGRTTKKCLPGQPPKDEFSSLTISPQ